jgi:hypothetical protein
MVVVKIRLALPEGEAQDLIQATGIIGSFFLPATGLSAGFIPSSTWPSTSGLESPGKGSRTP